MYLGFYPETIDRQKIDWVGTLLTDTTLVWHLHRYRELGENDIWVNYTTAIRAEYQNEREAADAQLKLGQLKYQGPIRGYLTEFRALNNFTRATSKALDEKVNLAMPDAVLDMRFAHYLEDFADDEGFLQASHQLGVQLEKKKALKAAREASKGIHFMSFVLHSVGLCFSGLRFFGRCFIGGVWKLNGFHLLFCVCIFFFVKHYT